MKLKPISPSPPQLFLHLLPSLAVLLSLLRPRTRVAKRLSAIFLGGSGASCECGAGGQELDLPHSCPKVGWSRGRSSGRNRSRSRSRSRSIQVGERCLTPDLVTGLSPHVGHPEAKVGIAPAPSSSSPACPGVPRTVYTCSLLFLLGQESLVQCIPAPFLLLPGFARSPLYSVYLLPSSSSPPCPGVPRTVYTCSLPC